MKNLLIAVDFENTDQQLLQHASAIALKFGSTCWVIHIAAPEPDFVGYQAGPQYIREMLAKDLKDEHKSIQKYVDGLRSQGCTAEGLMVQGPTVELLLEEVDKLAIDLIIIGAHKHSFLYRLFQEDTSLEIMHKTKVPLFIVPVG